jgi:hypothetical protein
MSSILNWEPTSTAGEFESMGGTYRIVPDAEGFTLISNTGKTLDGKPWTKRFTKLNKAMAWPRIRETEQEIVAHKITKALDGATPAKQSEVRRKYACELELVALIADDCLPYEPDLSADCCKKLNLLAARLAVTQRL